MRRHRPKGADNVSIHAPARGATISLVIVTEPPCFNSRAREGRDFCQSRASSPKVTVSIHAPARGATFFDNAQHVARKTVSIHAPARGATEATPLRFVWSLFQFTRPRGARLRQSA